MDYFRKQFYSDLLRCQCLLHFPSDWGEDSEGPTILEMSLWSGIMTRNLAVRRTCPSSASGGTAFDLWPAYVECLHYPKYLVHNLCADTVIPKPRDTLTLWSSPLVTLDTRYFCSQLSKLHVPELEAWLADSF